MCFPLLLFNTFIINELFFVHDQVQFVTVFLYYQINVMYYCDCPPNKVLVVFITINNFLFVYLFGKFYIDNYRKNGGLEAKTDKNLMNNNVDVAKRKIKAQ